MAKKTEKRNVFDDARCLHHKNSLGMTIGNYLGLNVGEMTVGVIRVSWTTWSVRGGKPQTLFDAFAVKSVA